MVDSLVVCPNRISSVCVGYIWFYGRCISVIDIEVGVCVSIYVGLEMQFSSIGSSRIKNYLSGNLGRTV